MEWTGKYWCGGHEGEPVRLTIAGNAVHIRRESGARLEWPVDLEWPIDEVRRGTATVSGTGVRLERNGGLVIVRDESILGALGWRAEPVGVGFGIIGASGIGLILLAMTAFAIFAAWQWGLPLVGQSLAKVVPIEWERRLGESVAAQYTAGGRTCPELERPVTAIVDRLAATMPATPYRFEVRVVDQPVVNALAAPGGYIVVFRGLVTKTAAPEELAAVLAHEMGHVVERHSTQMVFRSAALWAIIAYVSGDPTSLGAQVAGSLGELHFQRQQEEDADTAAMELLTRAHLKPDALVRVFQTLAKNGAEIPAYLSTHPRIEGRVERAQQWASSAHYPVKPLQVSTVWPPSDACR
ncbi:MAG: M48 family metallopeptidase [Bryobacterales bacterium]|nr:M48 family metallopeptidase [Bryobacterales bacterium]